MSEVGGKSGLGALASATTEIDPEQSFQLFSPRFKSGGARNHLNLLFDALGLSALNP